MNLTSELVKMPKDDKKNKLISCQTDFTPLIQKSAAVL